MKPLISITAFDSEESLKKFRDDPIGELGKLGIRIPKESDVWKHIMTQVADHPPSMANWCVVYMPG
jgi:hypothetical protein